MKEFNTMDNFLIGNENKGNNETFDINEKNKNKINIRKSYKNLERPNSKNLPRLQFLPKLSNTVKTNNYLINSFRTKYTCEKLRSIQVSYDINNIFDNSNNNNNKYEKNLISKSFGSVNIVKSIESINSLNSNNNFIRINKSQSNNINLKENLIEKLENNNNEVKTIKVNQKQRNNNGISKTNKNNYILNPDYNCTFNFPFRRLSFDEEIKRNANKFTTFVEKKFNFQKYSNLSMIPNQFVNKKNISIERDKKSNNFISISDNIEESIHSHFSNYINKLKSDSNKQVSNSQNSSVKKNNIFKNTNSENNENKLIFETNNNISYALDNIVGKIIKGKLFSWKVGDILYESGNSTIYKAFNINDGKTFVVKKYNCLEGIKCENYINEVKIYENLNHPNIIKYIFSEQINNYYFLYLEYIPGGSIKNIVEQFGGINERLIRKYTKQILLGLKYLHDNKIIHRDIKCANILIGDKGIIKLTDFGCSKKISLKFSKKDSSSNEEYCTSLKGTIPWCAPEVICHKKYGKKADIWSLGCTLLEMTGNQPWGKNDNIFQVMNKIGKTNLTPEIPDYLSNNFKDFLELCLKREPKKRANLKTLMKHKFITGLYF